jgi:hypothetical protein
MFWNSERGCCLPLLGCECRFLGELGRDEDFIQRLLPRSVLILLSPGAFWVNAREHWLRWGRVSTVPESTTSVILAWQFGTYSEDPHQLDSRQAWFFELPRGRDDQNADELVLL